MTPDETLDTFLAELRAAGQPWNRWGVWGSFLGVAGLLALQVTRVWDARLMEALFGLVIAVLATSWTCLVIAFVKRRRWEKAHPLVLPSLVEAQGGKP